MPMNSQPLSWQTGLPALAHIKKVGLITNWFLWFFLKKGNKIMHFVSFSTDYFMPFRF